jgi:hypothetical protein
VNSAQIRDKLARISGRPSTEWSRRVEQEFPDDPAMRMQALLWLHADKEGPELAGSPPSLGEIADERYELTVRVDVGSTSSVWQAFDRLLGRSVAIKVFHKRDPSEALDQVLAEARAASDVVSEHVVRVLDVQAGDGHPYIVMELVSEYDAEKGEVVLGSPASASRPQSIEEVARHFVVQLGESGADGPHRNQAERRTGDRARKQWLSRAQCDRPDLHEKFIQQAVIVKLAHEVSAADKPHVLAIRCGHHLGVDGADIPTDKSDVRASHGFQCPGTEDPGWLGVRPSLRPGVVGPHAVTKHPLIRGRPHRERTHVLDECRIRRGTDIAERKQPLQRVVECRDKPVEARGRVVLGLHHAFQDSSAVGP